ncbi:MAG: hypothetical protein J5813_06570 [Candidatus Methanomethylophilaceae archaeon]|nr:hypothetical protein [Candidatus Methanomethylophilaceae archaeon]
MKDTRSESERKQPLPERSLEDLCDQLTEEDIACNVGVQWATDVLLERASSLPLPLDVLTAAFLNCFIEGILAGVDTTGISIEEARIKMGIRCFEGVDIALHEARGGKDD